MSKKGGFQSLGRNEQSFQNEQSNSFEEIDFDRMTKKELKQFDEKYGSYRRLLNGKPITRWWLLNHYSKANAEAYRLQKKAEDDSNTRKEKIQKKEDDRKVIYDYGKEEKECREIIQETNHVSDHGEETIFIDREKHKREKMPKAYLDCMGFDQKVSIDEVPFIIGRDASRVQLCIADNLSIGRRHASITYSKGNYYIEDLNSKNHVYLNDHVIPVNRPVLLENQMQITLGDEEFIFYCED